MMKKQKILVVDNDVIARRAIAKILHERSDYDLVVNGDTASTEKQIMEHNPELLLLGIRATVVEELALLSTIRIRFPKLPVVILSERSYEGAAVAIAALRLGAIDFVTKPEYSNTLLFAEHHLIKRVIPIVKASLNHNQKNVKAKDREVAKFRKGKPFGLQSMQPLELITIGGCTGAPAALFSLLAALPEDLPIPILIVQHFPKNYTGLLAQKLNEVAKLTVREAKDGAVVLPGSVWIARGGFHCEVQRDGNQTRLRIHRGPPENGFRPSIDLLFRSAGRLYGPGVLGLILSGCGNDGVVGSGVIQQAGGQVVVQDPRTALAPDMPLSVIKAGHYDAYFPLDQIADQLIARAANKTLKEAGKTESGRETAGEYRGVRNLDWHLFSPLI